MRTIVGILVTVTAFGLTAVANEKPPAAFQQAMKDNSATMQKLAKDIEAKDFDAIAAGAAMFKKNFMPVSKYWADAKNDDGLKRATEASSAADNLEKAAKAKNEMAVADARKALQGTCGSCHMAHREQLPDKTFEIK